MAAQDKAPILGMVPAALLSIVSAVQMIVSGVLSIALYVLPQTECPRAMLENYASRMWDHGCVGVGYGIYNFIGLGFPLYHRGDTTIQRLRARAEF